MASTDSIDSAHSTHSTAAEVVRTYYATITGGTANFDPARLREILDPDLTFEGPLAGTVDGAERFIAGVTGFVQTVSEVTVLHRVAAGEQVASLYDAQMPGGVVRFAEFFQVTEGRIRSLRLLYDGGDYLAKGGR